MKIIQTIKGNHLLGDGFRFLIAGGLNTLITVGIYQLCLGFLSHNKAYAISWLVGILYLIIVYPTKVFTGNSFSITQSAVAVGVYLIVFLIGLWSLEQIINLGTHERLAIFIILAFSTLLNFTLMRILYRKKASPKKSTHPL